MSAQYAVNISSAVGSNILISHNCTKTYITIRYNPCYPMTIKIKFNKIKNYGFFTHLAFFLQTCNIGVEACRPLVTMPFQHSWLKLSGVALPSKQASDFKNCFQRPKLHINCETFFTHLINSYAKRIMIMINIKVWQTT